MNYPEHALAVLKDKGYRLTKPRKIVLDILDKEVRAVSAAEIRDLLIQSGEKIDLVSVYRILECLEEHHLVHRIAATGKVLKCLEHEHALQQEHLVISCQGCGTTEELLLPAMSKIVKSIEKSSAFKIQNHNLEFFGLCHTCQ